MEPGDGSVFTGFTLGLLTIDLDRGTDADGVSPSSSHWHR